MEPLLNWGVQIILWMQQFSPTLDLPFIGLTMLGSEDFFLVIVAFVFWCLDRRTGARLAVLLLASVWLNSVAKELLNQPRPFTYAPSVRMIYEATGGGLPSGHTQNTVVLWGYLALTYRRRWLSWLAGALMILVPLSRLYLGVHFPTDLLGAYLLGAALLGLYLTLEPGAEIWLAHAGLTWQLGLAVVAPLVLVALHPSADEALVTALGTLLGMGVGVALERRWVGFEASGSWTRRIACLVLGAAVMLLLRFGLKAAVGALEPEAVWRLVRYAAIGLWAGLGAPWAFVRLGWAPAVRRDQAPESGD